MVSKNESEQIFSCKVLCTLFRRLIATIMLLKMFYFLLILLLINVVFLPSTEAMKRKIPAIYRSEYRYRGSNAHPGYYYKRGDDEMFERESKDYQLPSFGKKAGPDYQFSVFG